MRWVAILLIVIGIVSILGAANIVTQEQAMDRKVGEHVLNKWLRDSLADGTLQQGTTERVHMREPARAVLVRPHFISSQAALGLALNGGLLIVAGVLLRRSDTRSRRDAAQA